MSGAVGLAGRAALRGGAGLVTVATPDVCADVVASLEPCYMTIPLPSQDGCLSADARQVLSAAVSRATVIACGPGLGRREGVVDTVRWLYESQAQPMVLDADALHALAVDASILSGAAGSRIVTPHLGEFRRLVGDANLSLEEAREKAVDVARDNGIVVLLKGHQTLVTDGQVTLHNETGNPGMATGGSGDVLTGLIAALLAQGMQPLHAAQLGAHLHGLAGDLAAADLGEVSLIAADLIEYLPKAFITRGVWGDTPQ